MGVWAHALLSGGAGKGGQLGQLSPTSWPDGVHQSVHLDVPVLDVGAGLSQFPLGRLAGMEGRGELVPHCS